MARGVLERVLGCLVLSAWAGAHLFGAKSGWLGFRGTAVGLALILTSDRGLLVGQLWGQPPPAGTQGTSPAGSSWVGDLGAGCRLGRSLSSASCSPSPRLWSELRHPAGRFSESSGSLVPASRFQVALRNCIFGSFVMKSQVGASSSPCLLALAAGANAARGAGNGTGQGCAWGSRLLLPIWANEGVN